MINQNSFNVGGAGALAGASGVFLVSGTSGEESGLFVYDGTVCLP